MLKCQNILILGHFFSYTVLCFSFKKCTFTTMFSIPYPVTIKTNQHIVNKIVNQY